MREVFEGLGFKNVTTVIASGNVIFDSPSKSSAALEKKIEDALPKKLGFTSTTMVLGQEELDSLVSRDPFKGVKDEKPNYLVVTFFKDRRKELCTVVQREAGKVPNFMRDVEKKYGKGNTTRTWKTIHRILKKM